MTQRTDTEYLSLLSEAAAEFVSLSARDDVYKCVAARLCELVGDAFVAVSSFDAVTRELRQRALYGEASFVGKHRSPHAIRFVGLRAKAPSDVVEAISRGTLLEIEDGLYGVGLRAFPHIVARGVERMARITGVFGMGCVAGGSCVGCVVIALRNNTEIPPVEVVEAMVNQAAITLHRRRSEDDIRRDREMKQRLERDVLEASERERQLLARDLHDSLGQKLVGTQFLARVLERKLKERGSPEAEDAAHIVDILREATQQTRRIARGLSPVDGLPGGLEMSLRQLADDQSRIFDVDVRFACSADTGLPRGTPASHLHLIAQEATTNAIRHGQAGTINIELSSADGMGQLQVRDDGEGISDTGTPSTGMGRRIMRYRAEMVGGTLETTSDAQGTCVTCRFPLSPASPRGAQCTG